MSHAIKTPKILIVDDLLTNIAILKRVLSGASAELYEARSGQKALDLCQEHDFAVVLLDVVMPEMDGFEVARRLRNNHLTRNMPILFITAYEMTSAQVIAAYDELRAVDFIQKPINERILLARVFVFLRLHIEKHAREFSIKLLAEQKLQLESEVKRRREVEEQLRLSHENITLKALDRESRLQATVENALDAIICTNERGVVVDFNPAAEKLFGYKREEVMGGDFSTLIVPANLRDRYQTRFADYVKARNQSRDAGYRTRKVDTLGVRADGKTISLEVALSSFKYEGETHVTAFFRDITDRKQFSRALLGTLEAAEDAHKELKKKRDLIAQAKAYTESIVDSMGDALIVLSMDGRIQMVNEPACLLIAASEEALLGKELFSFLSKDLLAKLGGTQKTTLCMDTIRLLQAQAGSVDGRLISEEGCQTPVLVSSSILRNSQGEEAGIILVAKDITEYTRSQEAMREKEKQLLLAEKEVNLAKDQFIAHMSHEIRTPMNAIIGLTDQALLTPLPDKARSYLEKVLRSSHFLMRIIDDILDFSKFEAGKLELERVDFSLDELLNHLIDLFSEQAFEKNIKLEITIPADCPKVLIGDSLRLEQVLMNLISNAVKFTDRGTVEVTVTVLGKRPDEVVLGFVVRDSGIGMSQEHLNKLFQPFVQVDGTTSRKYGGTGLGLAISKHLVEKMRGTIQVQSTLGKGSCFKFAAGFGWQAKEPAEGGEKTTGAVQKTDAAYLKRVADQIGGCRLLLAEDNRINQQVAQEILSHVGLIVEMADDGQQAVESVETSSYDLILMDVQMPVMDGYEATRRIRGLAQGKNLPIIAVTAHVAEADQQLCLESGMDDHIAKPIDKRQLFDVLLKWLSGKSKQRERSLPLPKEPSQAPPLPPTLKGVDLEAGLVRLMGNQALYRSLLVNFANEFAHVVPEVEASLSGENSERWQDARRLVHSVRGLAGNLGIVKVTSAASALEEAIAEEKREGWLAPLASFSASIKEVLTALSTLEEGTGWVDEGEGLDSQQLKERFAELAEAIQKKRFKAKILLAHLRPLLGAKANAPLVIKLEKTIDHFDFKEADNQLLALADALGVDWRQ
ncbi:MAG: response regulator [Magnetococcales bacterium]|nr:response regulator [Magnetococcales bacterium]